MGLEETKETVEIVETSGDIHANTNCMETERQKETKETVETRYTCKYKLYGEIETEGDYRDCGDCGDQWRYMEILYKIG